MKSASKLPDEEIRETRAAGLMIFPASMNALTSIEPKSQRADDPRIACKIRWHHRVLFEAEGAIARMRGPNAR